MSAARNTTLDAATARNHLLAALPADEFGRIAPSLELVRCPAGMILVDDGQPADRAYFPVTCIAARLSTMHNGATGEHGIVGRDGLVGIAAFLGGGPTPGRVETVIGGDALTMPAAPLLAEFRRGAAFQRLLLQYIQTLIVQVSVEAVCRIHHTAEQRLARLLLQVLDRWFSADFPLTQESLGMLLGARRETVSHATSHLQNLNLIRHERGHVRILDAEQLERIACECYQAVASRPGRIIEARP